MARRESKKQERYLIRVSFKLDKQMSPLMFRRNSELAAAVKAAAL